MKLYLLCAALISSAAAFTFPHTSIPRQRNVLFSSASDVLSEVNSMRVRQIKQELDEAGINTSDAFEKDELVKRLVEYRKSDKFTAASATQNSASSSSSDSSSSAAAASSQTRTPRTTSISTIRVPMDFHSLTPAVSVPSKNSNVFLRPSPGKYPSIQLTIPGQDRKLTLLVDTACTGLVFRPKVLKYYNLPSLNAGITMTAAGGQTNAGSVATLKTSVLDDGTKLDEMIVAGQDIGALPNALDGIIGLSFLNQFKKVAFDFANGELLLSKSGSDEMDFRDMEVAAKIELKLCKIGVWTVDTTLDSRGPVKLLLDTGAGATFLNWKGVQDLNMNRDHPLIQRNTEKIGAMGADNMALELSHRFVLKNRVNLVSDPSNVNPFGPLGLEMKKDLGSLNIDIADLPVLATLQSDNVGGIMGSDILMRCDILYFDLSAKPLPTVTMYNEREV
jgi:hypothetical protein